MTPRSTRNRKATGGNVNPIGLRSMYHEAKRFSEACTMAYHRERKAETRFIRIFYTYGPRMDPYDGRVVISFIRQALNHEPLTVFGEGKQTRSLCYDITRAKQILNWTPVVPRKRTGKDDRFLPR